ncbi:hypothetical protein MMC12_007907 [Toensbergia leucococca]|nr:hypothetical protein [Toensbergia leucococca]
MDIYILPSTKYESPFRQARKHKLNTIIEDEFSENEASSKEEEPGGGNRGRPRSSTIFGSIGSSSPVPSLTSSISSYYRTHRRSQDFDDLYDVSDDDSMQDNDITPKAIDESKNACYLPANEDLHAAKKTRARYPPLVIPSPSYWPTVQKLQSMPPQAPPKIPLSPAVLSLLSHHLPESSAPPSLAGSLSTDPLACSTAPVTPEMQIHPGEGEKWGQVEIRPTSCHQKDIFDINEDSIAPDIEIRLDDSAKWENSVDYNFEDAAIVRDFATDVSPTIPDSALLGTDDSLSEAGIHLPPDALDTLQHLSLEVESDLQSTPDLSREEEMQEIQIEPSRSPLVDNTPISEISGYSLAQISIPSPGGFFSSLGSNARHTWCVFGSEPQSAAPPSSTTAERFYNCPWNLDPQNTVKRIIEIKEEDTDTDGPPTARQAPLHPDRDKEPQTKSQPLVLDTSVAQSVRDYDEGYEKAIQHMAEGSIDRTNTWLAAQTSYMAVLREANPINDISLSSMSKSRRVSRHVREDSLGSPMKKAVRFLESETAKCGDLPKSDNSDPIHFRAFQHLSRESSPLDTFRHRQSRFEAIQASRISLPQEHRDQLIGNYRIVDTDRPAPLRPISMMPGLEDPEETAEQRVIARVERERQALGQVSASIWIIEAAKYLYGGGLLNSPAVNILIHARDDGSDISRSRVLDLGGQPSCDWAWHCSQEYRKTQFCTAIPEQHVSVASIPGPNNHWRVVVPRLWQLPYPNCHFDAISARSLYTYLKTEKPLGQTNDEYDLCLHECLRCLKPGGYLEFFILDSEVVNSGPRGTAVSVEFGFNLRTRGYDPIPTKGWLGRLRRAGFDDIKRAWTFLPMGAPPKDAYMLPETPPPNVSTKCMEMPVEAVHGPVGSTADAASVSGLVGSWAWEQWMVKLKMEMGRDGVLEGVGAVMEEGRFTGAGWRCLSGWARKPMKV